MNFDIAHGPGEVLSSDKEGRGKGKWSERARQKKKKFQWTSGGKQEGMLEKEGARLDQWVFSGSVRTKLRKDQFADDIRVRILPLDRKENAKERTSSSRLQ